MDRKRLVRNKDVSSQMPDKIKNNEGGAAGHGGAGVTRSSERIGVRARCGISVLFQLP